jgi:hypothetical protein
MQPYNTTAALFSALRIAVDAYSTGLHKAAQHCAVKHLSSPPLILRRNHPLVYHKTLVMPYDAPSESVILLGAASAPLSLPPLPSSNHHAGGAYTHTYIVPPPPLQPPAPPVPRTPPPPIRYCYTVTATIQ